MDAFISDPNIQVETTNGAGNLYFLQVNPNHSGSMECIPLQLIINDLDGSKEHYLRPVQLDTNLPHFTDACAVPSSSKYVNDEVFQEMAKLQQTLVDRTSSPSTNSKQSVPTIPTKSLKNPSNQENCAKQNNTRKYKHERKHQISFVHIADRTVPPRAVAVLPTALQFRRDFISPRRSLPERVRFGPLQGVRHEVLPAEINKLILDSVATHTPVFLISKEENSVVHVNVADKDKSNWLSLLPLGDLTTANVWLYEESGEVYGVTTKSIGPRTPLALGYSKKYAEDYGLPPDQPILDLEEALPVGPRQWWCSECHRAMGSAALLERHIDVHHKCPDEKPPPRRRYRCPHCTRTFSRLFTLKRHVLSFCTRKVEKSDKPPSSQSSPIKTNTVSYTTQNADDSKVPSDESLQNYTNSLDFSTNLFDTDRMPSLDISGSSKSEADFNPFGFKDESHLTNYLGNTNASHQNTEKSGETILFSCPHCDKTIVNSKKRQHFRQCAARRFECECGQVFNTKQSFERHIDKEHSHLKSRTLKDAAEISSEESYKCDDCKVSFKRRGMLVNHLWRVHNSVSTAVPLERRVRHYPCVACPKIYRTASKRDRHVKTHHPGTELIRAAPIEGERRACEPASCWECPRQYATRAKLLQHVRAHHPHLELPIRKKSTIKLGSKMNKQILPSLSQNCNYINN